MNLSIHSAPIECGLTINLDESAHYEISLSWIFWPAAVSNCDWNRDLWVRAFTITSVSESFATYTWIDPLESRQPVFSVEPIAEFCMRDDAGY